MDHEEEESVVVVDAVPFGDDELMMMEQDDDDIDDEHDDLPIIDLTPTAELHHHHLLHYTTDTTMTHAIFCDDNDILPYHNSNSYNSYNNDMMAVATVVEVVSFSLRDAHLEGGCSRCLGHTKRAQFISATFYKASKKTSLGFTLHRSESKIASIYEDGLARESPLREGDRITSVNNRDCSTMSSISICKLLKSLVGTVTIVVENPDGSPNVVESMVTKADPSDLCGVGLKGRSGHRLFISSLDADKLTADSLLNVGDQLLSINGISCQDMEAAEAAWIIRQTPKCVTIVAKTPPQTGVVLAEIATDKKDTMKLQKLSLSSGRKKAHSILRRHISHYTNAAWPQSSSRRSRASSPTTTTTTTTATSRPVTTASSSSGRSSSQRGRRTTRNARAVQRCYSQPETALHNLTGYDWEVDV